MYQTLLVDAAVRGDAASITKILATPGFVPQNACFGALSIAAEKRQVEAVRLMLEHFPVLMDWQYNVVTDRAIEQGNLAVLLAVLSNPRATPQQKAARFEECLEKAMNRRHDHIVEQLLLTPGFPLTEKTLRSAIKAQNARAVETMLADPRCTIPNDVLDRAAQSGNVDVVRAVLRDPRAGAWLPDALTLLCARNDQVVSAIVSDPRFVQMDRVMHDLASAGRNALIGTLLQDPRLDPNTAADVLWQAALGGHAATVRMFLQDGRWSPTSAKGRLAIETAAGLGDIEVIEAFVEDARVTGEPQHVTIKGALLRAASAGREQVIRRLLAVPGITLSNDTISQLVFSGDVRTLQILVEEERFVPRPGMLREAVSADQMGVLRLFLRDPRVRDIGHSAIQGAVLHKNREAIARLLISWEDPDDRAQAAEIARDWADEELANYIDSLAGRSEAWFKCMNVLASVNHDAEMHVLFELAYAAERQGLDAAALQLLHAEGLLEPMLDKVFGRGLSRSFSEVFASNYTTLATFSEVSVSPELSAKGRKGSSENAIRINDVMPEVIRRLTTGLSESAADLLWQRVSNNTRQVLAGKSQSPTLSNEEIARNQEAGMLADLTADCITQFTSAALALSGQEKAPGAKVESEKFIEFQTEHLWKLKAVLRVHERDTNVPLQEAAHRLTQALERFTAAVHRRDGTVLPEVRAEFRKALEAYENRLSEAGRTVNPQLLAAAQDIVRMPNQELLASYTAVLLALPPRDVHLEI